MKTVKIKCRNERGFTLIEIMIALAVLVIGVVGAFSMQLVTIKGNSNAIGITKAVHEVSAALDVIESLDYNHTDLSEGSDIDVNYLFPGGTPSDFEGTLTYDVEEKNAAELNTLLGLTNDNFPGSNAKLVKVYGTIYKAGQPKNVELHFVKIDY